MDGFDIALWNSKKRIEQTNSERIEPTLKTDENEMKKTRQSRS